jgi:hypothetical protein
MVEDISYIHELDCMVDEIGLLGCARQYYCSSEPIGGESESGPT